MLTLNMIVKDESKVITRCLESVVPFIDAWVILDTGSTDGTQRIIQEYLKDIPGILHQRPFVDFATTRTEAVRLCQTYRGGQGHGLTIDADEVLVCDPDFDPKVFQHSLCFDLYDVQVKYGNLSYHRSLVYSLGLPWEYKGVVHEFLTCPQDFTRGMATGFHLHPRPDGSRSADPEKFLKDAAVIEQALLTEQDPLMVNRYRFYLGQCYRDAGKHEQAYLSYLERGKSGGWTEEQAVALLNAANSLLEFRGSEALDRAVALFFEAHRLCPTRAEPLYMAARLCRMHARFDQAHNLAQMGLRVKRPARGLFVMPDVYDWGMAEEYGLACYWTRRHAEAALVFKTLLEQDLPEHHRQRLQNNLNFSQKELDERGRS